GAEQPRKHFRRKVRCPFFAQPIEHGIACLTFLFRIRSRASMREYEMLYAIRMCEGEGQRDVSAHREANERALADGESVHQLQYLVTHLGHCPGVGRLRCSETRDVGSDHSIAVAKDVLLALPHRAIERKCVDEEQYGSLASLGKAQHDGCLRRKRRGLAVAVFDNLAN